MRTHKVPTALPLPAAPRVSVLRPYLVHPPVPASPPADTPRRRPPVRARGLRRPARSRRSAVRLLSALLTAALTAGSALPTAAIAEAAEAPRLEVSPPQPAPRLDIRRRSGLEPADRASMDAWYRRYRRGAAPVKKALADLLEARRLYRPHQLGPECRALHTRVRRFLAGADDEGLFPLRDTAADYHLRHLYRQLEAAATACLRGRWAASDAHLRRAGRAFRQARLALGRWELTP